MQELIPIREASDLILENMPVLGWENISLDDAYGRVLAGGIVTDRPIPPYDRAMMDGIAICHRSFAQGRREFPIAGTQAAGAPALTLGDPSQCLEIMTGAIAPKGADCVIKIEEIEIKNGIAHVPASCHVRKEQHIHSLGSDQKTGAALVSPGTVLGAPELAIAASVGQTELLVNRLPNILLITTGNEVIPPEATPLPHQIRGSHAHAIRASIEPNRLGNIHHTHVPDTPEDLRTALEKGLGKNDLLILTGGISMGKYDYVAPVLQSLAGAPCFHGVAQRPGKPLAFWTHHMEEESRRAILALPGNPVSVMACLARYVLPALRAMRGESWKPASLPLAHDFIWNAPFPGLVACQVFANQIHPSPPRNSGDYTALAGSQGICEINGTSQAGTILKFHPW